MNESELRKMNRDLCSHIKKASTYDAKYCDLLDNAFNALSKLIESVAIIEDTAWDRNRALKNEVKNILCKVFYYLIYHEKEIRPDTTKNINYSDNIYNILKVDNYIIDEVKKERKKKSKNETEKYLNLTNATNRVLREFEPETKEAATIVGSLSIKLEDIINKVIELDLSQCSSKYQNYLTDIKECFELQKKYELQAYNVALFIESLPEIKSFILTNNKGLIPFYDKALKKTESSVKKRLYKWANIDLFEEIYIDNINCLKKVDCTTQEHSDFIREKYCKWAALTLQGHCRNENKANKIRQKKGVPSDNIASTSNQSQFTYKESLPYCEKTNIDAGTGISINDLNGLEKNSSTKDNFERNYIKYINYIKEDPEGKLKELYVRNNPECNCQYLLSQYFIKNKTLTEISDITSISIGTLQYYLPHKKRVIEYKKKRKRNKCWLLLEKLITEKDC